MDPSFLEFWRDVRSLAFNEEPDYGSLKSLFVQCWERKGFGGSPGEYDWLALFKFNRLKGAQEKTQAVQPDNAPEVPSVSVALPLIAPGNPSHSSH
jgi:hypothetical protein